MLIKQSRYENTKKKMRNKKNVLNIQKNSSTYLARDFMTYFKKNLLSHFWLFLVTL